MNIKMWDTSISGIRKLTSRDGKSMTYGGSEPSETDRSMKESSKSIKKVDMSSPFFGKVIAGAFA